MNSISSQNWLALTKAFQKPDRFRSWMQVLNSFGPFFLLWTLAYLALGVSVWLMLPLALMASFFGLRIFIIQHDCGHGSFFKKAQWRDLVGLACSFITLTPYRAWQWEHAQHHAHSGKIEHRDLGEIIVLTAEEFVKLSAWEKFKYRVYRFPPVTFLVGPAWVFFGFYRWPYFKKHGGNKIYQKSVWFTNFVLFGLFTVGVYTLGWNFLWVHLTIIYFTATMGVWMFYVQHQFEDGYWQPTQNWDRAQAAVHGSSFFKLPKILQWISGNIGYHHIHHLNPLIPNYELEACHNENQVFQEEVTTLTLANCWETMKLKFWDEKLERMISWKEMKAMYLKKS